MTVNRKAAVAPVPAAPRIAPLSSNEEITLRRVAFGESPVLTLRAADLVQLRRLRLIEEGKDGPRLTAEGKTRFEALPKAMSRADAGAPDLMAALAQFTSRT